MASTTNKPFHTYENVGYDDQTNIHYVPPTVNNTSSGITSAVSANTAIAVNKTAIDSPFVDPVHGKLMPKFIVYDISYYNFINPICPSFFFFSSFT